MGSSAIEVTVTVVADGEAPDSASVSGLLHEANDSVSTAA